MQIRTTEGLEIMQHLAYFNANIMRIHKNYFSLLRLVYMCVCVRVSMYVHVAQTSRYSTGEK